MEMEKTISKNRQEIDLIDLALDWLSHWRSILVSALIGCIIGGVVVLCQSFLATDMIPEPPEAKEAELKQTGGISEFDKKDVENLIEEYNAYNLLVDQLALSDYTMTEKADALQNVVQTGYYLNNRIQGINTEQRKVFETRMNNSQFDNAEANDSIENNSEYIDTKSSNSKTILNMSGRMLVFAFAAIVIHAIICCFAYSFNNRLKPTDRLGVILGCADISQTVLWKKIDSKRGLDRIIARLRVRGDKYRSYSEAQIINAGILSDIILKNGIKTVALVYGKLKEQADELEELVKKDQVDANILCVKSVTQSEEDVKKVSAADGVIVLAQSLDSSITELCNEENSLRNRKIPLVGAITYHSL